MYRDLGDNWLTMGFYIEFYGPALKYEHLQK